MVDSIITWAREYKVDGFRFDLMGHHSLANMLTVREGARQARRPARRSRRQAHLRIRRGMGLRRGRRWRAVRSGPANSSLAVPASARSATVCVTPFRGGGPFDADPHLQGFGAGLFTDPNGATVSTGRRPSSGRGCCCTRSDQGWSGRQPARLRLRSPYRRGGLGCRGRLQRSTGRLRRCPGRHGDLCGRPRQRDAVRRLAVQAAADRADGGTGPDEHAGPGHDHPCHRARRSGTRVPTCCARSPWTATPTTRATGSTASTGRPPSRRGARAFHHAPTTRPSGPTSPAAGGPGPGTRAARYRRARGGFRRTLRIRFSSPLFRPATADRIQRRVTFPLVALVRPLASSSWRSTTRRGKDPDPRWEGWSSCSTRHPTPRPRRSRASLAVHAAPRPSRRRGSDRQVGPLQPGGGAFTLPARTVAVFTTT